MAEKKSRRRWILLTLFLVAVMVVGVLFLALLARLAGRPATVSRGILEVVIRGPMAEGPSQDPVAQLMAGLGLGARHSLWDLRQALERAAKDPRVLGVRLELLGGVGWGVADEIVGIVDRFRESGKPVYSYLRGDFAADTEYYLATAGDQLWLSPGTGLLVNGLHFEVEFWSGTLDKVHIEPTYLMLEEYKSAGEPFSRPEMSPYFEEALSELGEDIQSRMVSRIAERRQITPAAVRDALDLGLLTGLEAMEESWADRLGFTDEIEASLAQEVGIDEYRGIKLSTYVEALGRRRFGGQRVALIFGEGAITATAAPALFAETGIHGDRLAEVITEAAARDGVRAIVLRVNSPGGSAVGSDHVWRAIEKAQEAGKPVIISMSDVAGSGGYWIAMGADRIVAQPNTITGSIGVVFGKFNLSGFYEWIGANVSDVTLAQNADILSFFEAVRPEHEERFLTWMNQVYHDFQSKVAEGRGLPADRVAEIAKGRIWSGTDALDLGLVDQLGGLGEALELARELGKLPDDAPTQIFPRERSLFEILTSEEPVGIREALTRQPGGPVRDLLRWLSPELRGELDTPRPWAVMPRIRID